MAVRTECLVQAFAAKTALLCDLRHAMGSCDNTQSISNKRGIADFKRLL